MHELVKRLRSTLLVDNGHGGGKFVPINPDGRHAAKVIEKQAERIERLEKALRPFAAFAENVDEQGWTSNIHREGVSVWFGPSDFREARQALSPTEDE